MRRKIPGLLRNNRGFVVFFLLMAVFRGAIADWNVVPTGSMIPTILEGDRILVNKLAYDINLPFSTITLLEISNPKRGDIVVFNSDKAQKRLVKRVVAVPGDLVVLRNNQLMINGESAVYQPLVRGSSSGDDVVSKAPSIIVNESILGI